MVNVKLVSISLGFFFLAVTARFFKWTFLVRSRSATLSWQGGWHAVMIGNLANFILPVRAGEVVKPVVANKAYETPFKVSIAASVDDKLSQLVIMLLFLFCMPLAGFFVQEDTIKRYITLLAIAVLSIVICCCLGKKISRFFFVCLRVFFFLLGKITARIDIQAVESKTSQFFHGLFHEISSGIISNKALAPAAALSLFIILLDGLAYQFLFQGFGLKLTWIQGAVASCLVCFAFILPTPPAQIGSAEMIPLMIFSWGLDLPGKDVSVVVLVWHIMTIGVVICLGTVSLIAMGMSFRKLNAVANRQIPT